MGLIREPKNVDFYVIDKAWTDKEKRELSAFIKLRKSGQKKHKFDAAKKKQHIVSH